MSNFQDIISAGLSTATEIFGTSFVYKTKTYYGVQTENDFTLELAAGGFKSDNHFSLYCIKSDFTALPEPGETLTLGGVEYRFVHVITSQDDPGVRFDCTCTDS